MHLGIAKCTMLCLGLCDIDLDSRLSRASSVVTVSATVADFKNVIKCRKAQNHHLSKDNTN